MKLLILTQKVDKNDDVLGFFVRWIEEFQKKVEKLSVICLEKGEVETGGAPIYSLGKERGVSKIKYIQNLFKYIWTLRKEYDTVFVHMNEEYVLLAGLLWKVLGKKILLWRNHPHGSFKTRVAVFLADKVYCTSAFSFTASFKKTELMPAGIDTNFFCREEIKRTPHSLLYLGRISSIKKVENILEAVCALPPEYTLNLFGDKVNKSSEVSYYNKIRKDSSSFEKIGKVVFKGSVPNCQTKDIFNSHEILINMTPSGSFDKVILEMMATEGLVLVQNKSFEEIFPTDLRDRLLVKENDTTDLKEKISYLSSLGEAEKKQIGKRLREIVVRDHSLSLLVQKIVC